MSKQSSIAADGTTLYGDDFSMSEIEAWFEDEREGYADLVQSVPGRHNYVYHALNQRFGFRHLGQRRFRHALGFGAAFGDEFEPVRDRISRLTILDPSDSFVSPTVCGIPSSYVKPEVTGALPFSDREFDLVTCFGVLHHIPNVSFVLREIARCLEPGGQFLVREPIVSLGKWWDGPRPGLTKRERGLPREWFIESVREAGLDVQSVTDLGFPPLVKGWARIVGKSAYDSNIATLLDSGFARLFRWNYKYHAESRLGKLRPTSLFMVLTKKSEQSKQQKVA